MEIGNVLAFGLMGTAMLIAVKDVVESRPGAWLEGAERLLGKRIHVAKTGSPEEVTAWVAEHGGTTRVTDEQRSEVATAIERARHFGEGNRDSDRWHS